MEHPPEQHTGLLAHLLSSAVAAGYWAIDQLWRHGPSWSVLPPLVIATTGLVGACNTFLNDRHRRKAERAHLDGLRAAKPAPPPSFDQIEAGGQ